MKKKLVVLTGAGMSAEVVFRLSVTRTDYGKNNWYSTFITNDVGNY